MVELFSTTPIPIADLRSPRARPGQISDDVRALGPGRDARGRVLLKHRAELPFFRHVYDLPNLQIAWRLLKNPN